MSRLRAVVAVLTLGAPFAAGAADVTRVASSFEDDDPFGLFIDIGFEHTQRRTKILREQLPDASGGTRQYANEVWYAGGDSRLNLDMAVGLYRDVQLTFGMPIVIARNESVKFIAGTTAENSSITNNCVKADGSLVDASCGTTGANAQPLFAVPGEVFRGGLGNMRFGLAWSVFNQRHDETKPTWVVGLDYEAPTAKMLDPSVLTAPDARGDIGDRTHKYTMYTALSRRIGVADPYFRMHYTIPVRGPGFYSNCDSANANIEPPNLGWEQNCGLPEWDRKTTGIQAPHTGGVMFGSEFTVYDKPGRKMALDARIIGNYVSEGRYYNELSGMLRKLLYTADYAQFGGRIGLTAQLSDVLSVRGSGMYLYNTDHALTDEKIGKDLDDNGTVDLTDKPEEINPNFDFRTDFVSRRFYATESRSFNVELSATFRF
jgi:hypothetical protein